jgi:hypothetical protein
LWWISSSHPGCRYPGRWDAAGYDGEYRDIVAAWLSSYLVGDELFSDVPGRIYDTNGGLQLRAQSVRRGRNDAFRFAARTRTRGDFTGARRALARHLRASAARQRRTAYIAVADHRPYGELNVRTLWTVLVLLHDIIWCRAIILSLVVFCAEYRWR